MAAGTLSFRRCGRFSSNLPPDLLALGFHHEGEHQEILCGRTAARFGKPELLSVHHREAIDVLHH